MNNEVLQIGSNMKSPQPMAPKKEAKAVSAAQLEKELLKIISGKRTSASTGEEKKGEAEKLHQETSCAGG